MVSPVATAATTDKAIRVSAMEARYGIIHARTLQAVGVGTTHGDLIRGQIPTSYHPASPAPVPAPTPA